MPSASGAFRALGVSFLSHFCLISTRSAERLFVLLGALRQLGHRDPESGGDSLQRGPGRIGEATLDDTKRRRRDSRVVRDRFLGRAAPFAEFLDRLAECWLRLF